MLEAFRPSSFSLSLNLLITFVIHISRITISFDSFRIPLPGELSGGIPARFDRHGFLRQPKRSYKKKVGVY